MTFNFADFYRQISLSPTSELISARQNAFEKLRKERGVLKYLALIDIYFGRIDEANVEWFRQAFFDEDNTFSLVNNARECSLLAASLLQAAMADGKTFVGLALLSAYANGARPASEIPTLIDDALLFVSTSAESTKKFKTADLAKLQQTVKARPTGDQAVTTDWIDGFASQIFSNMSAITAHQRLLIEETEMLWWYIGGWSKKLRVHFETLSPIKRSIIAGLDLADISSTFLGPASAPAILAKIVASDNSTSFTILEIVDAFSPEELTNIPVLNVDNPFCFPILTAFQKAREIGVSPSWHQNYEKTCGISINTTLDPLNLSLQIFREALLLKAIEAS